MDEGVEEEKEEEEGEDEEEEAAVCAVYTRPGKPYSRVVFTARKRHDSTRDPREASRLHLPVPSLLRLIRALDMLPVPREIRPEHATCLRKSRNDFVFVIRGDILARANGLIVDLPEQNADIPAFPESFP